MADYPVRDGAGATVILQAEGADTVYPVVNRQGDVLIARAYDPNWLGGLPGAHPLQFQTIENGPQGNVIGTFIQDNAITPTGAAISNVVPAGSLQLAADGVTLQYGPRTTGYDEYSSLSGIYQYSDARGGPYTFVFFVDLKRISVPTGGVMSVRYVVEVDNTTPVVSAFSLVKVGSTGFSGSATMAELSGEAFGTFDYVVYPSANAVPDQAQIALGKDGTNANAPGGKRSINVALNTPQSVSGNGLAGNTTYKASGVFRDNGGNTSAVFTSNTFTTDASASVPGAFTAGMWTITDLATGGDARVSVGSLPADGGAAITAIKYRINGGSLVTTGITGVGTFDITSGLTDGVSANVEIFATNSVGNSAASDVKAITTTTFVPVFIRGYGKAAANTPPQTVSLTNLTAPGGATGISAQPDDLIIAVSGWASDANYNPGPITSGYTELINPDLYGNDTRDINLDVSYKFMGATPDTSLDVAASNNAAHGSFVIVLCIANVDLTTPFDGAVATATGIDGDIVDAPSQTPTVANTMLIAGGASSRAANPGANGAGPANMTDITNQGGSGTTRSAQCKVSSLLDPTVGVAFDPAAWTGTPNSASDAWAAFSFLLRHK